MPLVTAGSGSYFTLPGSRLFRPGTWELFWSFPTHSLPRLTSRRGLALSLSEYFAHLSTSVHSHFSQPREGGVSLSYLLLSDLLVTRELERSLSMCTHGTKRGPHQQFKKYHSVLFFMITFPSVSNVCPSRLLAPFFLHIPEGFLTPWSCRASGILHGQGF